MTDMLIKILKIITLLIRRMRLFDLSALSKNAAFRKS